MAWFWGGGVFDVRVGGVGWWMVGVWGLSVCLWVGGAGVLGSRCLGLEGLIIGVWGSSA